MDLVSREWLLNEYDRLHVGEPGKAREIIASAPTIEQSQWIPVSERLPDGAFGCLVTVWDTNPVTMDEFENVLPYFVGWDGEQWNDADGEQCPFEVIAWMPLPKAFEGEA